MQYICKREQHFKRHCNEIANKREETANSVVSDYVQVSQVPHRGDLGSEGEINYKYVLNVLKEAGYDGIVGLEYLPAGACYVYLAMSTHVLLLCLRWT